jgi:hypothetical protein
VRTDSALNLGGFLRSRIFPYKYISCLSRAMLADLRIHIYGCMHPAYTVGLLIAFLSEGL